MQALGVALVIGLQSWAAFGETVQVKGQEIEAHDIEYYPDGGISNFNVAKPVTFTLARGNQITATDLVYVYPNEDLKLISSPGALELNWKAGDGRSVRMECSAHPRRLMNPASARIVSFYQAGEYKSGCELKDATVFSAADVQLTVKGSFDATPDFQVMYAQEVIEGKVTLTAKGEERQTLLVKPGSDIAFYPSGVVRFLTPGQGQSFTRQHPLYGKIRYTQGGARDVAMTFFEDGTIEQGILGQSFIYAPLGLEIPESSGVMFDSANDLALAAVVLSKPLKFAIKGYEIVMSRFVLSPQTGNVRLTLSEPFAFIDPQTGDEVQIPVGSEVILDKSRAILEIDTPQPKPGT